jgi:hypothetical protein
MPKYFKQLGPQKDDGSYRYKHDDIDQIFSSKRSPASIDLTTTVLCDATGDVQNDKFLIELARKLIVSTTGFYELMMTLAYAAKLELGEEPVFEKVCNDAALVLAEYEVLTKGA